MSTTTTTTTTKTTRDRGERYGPIEWAQSDNADAEITNKNHAGAYVCFCVTAMRARAMSSGYVIIDAVVPAREPAMKRYAGSTLLYHIHINSADQSSSINSTSASAAAVVTEHLKCDVATQCYKKNKAAQQ